MDRTIPSFRIVLAEEKAEWKLFRNILFDKSNKKDFDDMFDSISRLYSITQVMMTELSLFFSSLLIPFSL